MELTCGQLKGKQKGNGAKGNLEREDAARTLLARPLTTKDQGGNARQERQCGAGWCAPRMDVT